MFEKYLTYIAFRSPSTPILFSSGNVIKSASECTQYGSKVSVPRVHFSAQPVSVCLGCFVTQCRHSCNASMVRWIMFEYIHTERYKIDVYIFTNEENMFTILVKKGGKKN